MPALIAILVAIWEFLVALGPLLIAVGEAIVQLFEVAAELAAIYLAIVAVLAFIQLLFDPRGATKLGNLLSNIVGGGLKAVSPLVSKLSSELLGVGDTVRERVKNEGATLAATIGSDFQTLATTFLEAQRESIGTIGESTPTNAIDAAGAAFKVAFGAGFSSWAVTAAFEALLPEKLNVLNGAGPLLATMAGFAEVAGNVLEPLYKNAFGRSLEYLYQSQFKPDYPDEAQAVTWHSRGLITDDDLAEIFNVTGLKAKYEAPYIQSAYRPLSAFILVRIFEAGLFDRNTLIDLMRFSGVRPSDFNTIIEYADFMAAAPERSQALSAVLTAAERGTLSDAEIDTALQNLRVPPQATPYVHYTVSYRRLEQLAELYRKSVSDAYLTGQLTDADYVPHLEAIGIGQADAEAHYAIDSIKLRGKALAAATRETVREQAAVTRAGVQTAIAGYEAGDLDPEKFTLALIAAGLAPTLAGAVLALQVERRKGKLVFIAGRWVSHDEAPKLRAQLAAVERQYKSDELTYEATLHDLELLGVPEGNRLALTAQWSAALSSIPKRATEKPIGPPIPNPQAP